VLPGGVTHENFDNGDLSVTGAQSTGFPSRNRDHHCVCHTGVSGGTTVQIFLKVLDILNLKNTALYTEYSEEESI
jgi:hypothetical protein